MLPSLQDPHLRWVAMRHMLLAQLFCIYVALVDLVLCGSGIAYDDTTAMSAASSLACAVMC